VRALAALVTNKTADTIALSNGVDLECRPASKRTIRGVTTIGIIADEIAFWRTEEESRNQHKEILDAARPSLATTGGMLIVISSPYAKRGELWNAFKRDYGPAGDPKILVAKGASRTLNPTLPERVVTRAYERDAVSASSEFGAEFRSDIAGFLDFAIVESAIDCGVRCVRRARACGISADVIRAAAPAIVSRSPSRAMRMAWPFSIALSRSNHRSRRLPQRRRLPTC
jgi:hypothetical protein